MKRIQLEFSDQKHARLRQLMEESDLDTYKDFFNNAIGLFDWCVEQVQDGRTIAALKADENKYRELAMPALRYAATHKKVEVTAG